MMFLSDCLPVHRSTAPASPIRPAAGSADPLGALIVETARADPGGHAAAAVALGVLGMAMVTAIGSDPARLGADRVETPPRSSAPRAAGH